MVPGLLDQLLGPMEVQLRKSGHNELGLGVLRVGKGPVGDGGYGFWGVYEAMGDVPAVREGRSGWRGGIDINNQPSKSHCSLER